MRLLLAFLLALSAGCAPDRNTSSVISKEEGYATIVLVNDDVLDRGWRVLGPEAKSVNGWTFRFLSSYKTLGTGKYRVPAGTVIFTLKRGLHTKRGRSPLGFQAKSGEVYEIRVDPISSVRRITVLERGTGRIATPVAPAKPLIKPARYR